MINRRLHILLIIHFLFLSGCYFADHEVISASMAIKTPYSHNEVVSEKVGILKLDTVTDNNDYRYLMKYHDGSSETGTIRALHLRDNIYILQVKGDEEPDYEIGFFEITRDQYKEVLPVEYEEIDTIAYNNKVTIYSDAYTDSLEGEPEGLLAFLLAHKNLAFENAPDF